MAIKILDLRDYSVAPSGQYINSTIGVKKGKSRRDDILVLSLE